MCLYVFKVLRLFFNINQNVIEFPYFPVDGMIHGSMEYKCWYTKIPLAEWFYKTDLNIFSAPRVIKEKQKMFQIDNGLRVHERGGQGDKVQQFNLQFGGYQAAAKLPS